MRINPIQEHVEAFFGSCFKVLQFYTCPQKCEAFCCKSVPISFEKYEYDKIRRHFPHTKHVLRGKKTSVSIDAVEGYHVITYTFTENLCPLLENDKCSVQSVKPTVCRLYPFTAKSGDPELIAIDPCPLGIEVMKDYILFRTITLRCQYPGDASVEKIIEDDKRHLYDVIKQVENFRNMKIIPVFYIPTDTMEAFYYFLKTTTQEARLEGKRKLEID